MVLPESLAPDGQPSFSRVIAAAWAVFAANAKTIFLFTLFNSIGTCLLIDLPQYYFASYSPQRIIGCAIMGFVIFPATIGPITILLAARIGGEAVTAAAAIKKAVSLLPRYAVMTLLNIFIVCALSLLLIVPGIIFAVFYIFATEALFLRNYGGMQALLYSKRLVEGNWWVISGFVFIALAATYGLTFVADSLLAMLIQDDLPAAFLTNIPVDFFAYGFCSAVSVLLFLTLERTKGPESAAETAPS